MSILQVVERDRVLVVDSRIIAEELGIQHKNFLATIEKYSHKMAESPTVKAPAFEARTVKLPQGGSYQERIAWLTEPQANFIMSLSRNTDEVVNCKLALVEAFEKAKQTINERSQVSGEPYWYKRVKLFVASNKVPPGYFSIFQETIGLVAELEAAGYVLPDNALPDGSVGKCWANHLRSRSTNPKSVSQPYQHHYPGWAHSVPALAYQESLLPQFRQWFRETYRTQKLPTYLKGKDANSLPALAKVLDVPLQLLAGK